MPDGLAPLLDKLSGNEVQKLRKRGLAMFIEEELQLAPWVLTRNLHEHKLGRGRLALFGVADPSGCGEGFAMTKLPPRDVKEAKAAAAADRAAKQTPKKPVKVRDLST